MRIQTYDVTIIGAGPAGCICAYQLSKSGLKTALVEKNVFPRDKICGDALGADVVNQLERIDPKLFSAFEKLTEKIASHGVRFVAPNHEVLDVPFANPKHTEAAGYVAKRLDFDNFLYEQVCSLPNIDLFQNEEVDFIEKQPDFIRVKTNKLNLVSKIVVGADGANSVVNRQLANLSVEKDHFSAGLRQYYQGVEGFHDNNHIELHFYKDVLPGYFWIFPLPDGKANVGLGMLSSEVSKKKVDLKKKLADIIDNHPNIKSRFKNAIPLESVKGFGLPLGSKRRDISGDGYLLLGDAAGLIDPFTGEGIANAIRSGRIAADHIVRAIDKNRFNAEFNKQYDREIYDKMWDELRIGRSLQKLLNYPGLFNFIVKKANKSESIRLLLTSMFDNVDIKKELLKLSFYTKLFFN